MGFILSVCISVLAATGVYHFCHTSSAWQTSAFSVLHMSISWMYVAMAFVVLLAMGVRLSLKD